MKWIISNLAVESKSTMSDSEVPCKSFSAVLNKIVGDLIDKNLKQNAIPKGVWDIKAFVLQAFNYKGVIFSHGIMGCSFESLRQIDENEYELHINLEFPFELTPIRDNDRPGFVMLKAEEKAEHQAIVDGFLNRETLNAWFYSIVKLYLYCAREAEFKKNYKLVSRELNFKLTCLPVVEFDYSKWPLPDPLLPAQSYKAFPWYAIPQTIKPFDQRSFMAWAPDWERCSIEMNPFYRKVEILMTGLLTANEIKIPKLKDVVQTTMVHAILAEKEPTDLGVLLIIILDRFKRHLEADKLFQLFTDNANLFRCVNERVLENYHSVISNVLGELKKYKSQALTEEQDENGKLNPEADWIKNLKFYLIKMKY